MTQSELPRAARGFDLLGGWIVTRRWTTLGLLAVTTALAALGHSGYSFLGAEPAENLLRRQRVSSADDPPQSPDVNPVRVAYGEVIVVARSKDFFTPSGAAAIRAAVAALEALPQVDNVLWMDEAPMLNLFGLPEPILPNRHASAARFAAARERAMEHPLVNGQLMSPDGETLLLMVRLDWLFVASDADCTSALREAAANAAAEFSDAHLDFKVTGNIPIRINSLNSNQGNERKFQLIGYAMSLVIAYVLFRGIAPVFIVALAPAFGVFWTIGAFHFLGYNDNPFNAVVVPVLLCMVGFTDGVHMMVQIRRHRAAGLPSGLAARKAIAEVGMACWLTSLTTAIGFGSLAVAHHPIVREFGYSCVIGVLATFVSVITIIPLACASPLGRRVHEGYGKNLVDMNLARISGIIDWVLAHEKLMVRLGLGSTALFALLALQLRPDERLTGVLPAEGEASQALAHIDDVMGGMETAHVSIDWPETVAPNSGEIGEVAERVEEALRKESLIGHPLSIASLLAALPGDGPARDRMSLLELMPPPLKRAYYEPENRNARATFRLRDIGIATYGPVFQRIERDLEQIAAEHPQFSLSLQGGAVRRWKNLYQIVIDLVKSLGAATAIIFAVMTIAYRSLRVGLISLAPNLFPLASTGVLLLLVGQNLEIVSVCAFTVC
ncbi:MAG: MMPL family transporter, partial [Planctomycetales bacterium]|nr:MMPL family transporter [Planctomycetales bacterium]